MDIPVLKISDLHVILTNTSCFQVTELISEATFNKPQRAAINQSFENIKGILLKAKNVPASKVCFVPLTIDIDLSLSIYGLCSYLTTILS